MPEAETTNIEGLRERHRALVDEYEEARRRVNALRDRLDPAGALHLKAEALQEPEAIEERDRVRADLAEAERRAADLAGRRGEAYSRVQAVEGAERREKDKRMREAIAFTQRVEADFSEELGRLGWYLQPAPEVQHEYERVAVAHIRDLHGDGPAEHCRNNVLPALGPNLSMRVIS